jgi:hypothetical protein
MKMVLTFKGGGRVAVDVTEFTTRKNSTMLSRDAFYFEHLTWTTPADWTSKLHAVDLSEVVCIHIERSTSHPSTTLQEAVPDGE